MATRPKAAGTGSRAAAAVIGAPVAVVAADVAETVIAEPASPEAPAAPIAAPAQQDIMSAGVQTTPIPVTQRMEKVVKTAEEFVAFGQGNVEAFVKSGQIWAAGVQDLSKQVAANAQAQFDDTLSAFKAMTAIKSVKDLFELQSAFAKSAMEKTMTESGKLTDASLKLTEQVLAPITARVTTAVETFGKAA